MKTPNQIFAEYSASKTQSEIASVTEIVNQMEKNQVSAVDISKYGIRDVCLNETTGQWKDIQVTKVFIGFHPHFGFPHLCIEVKQKEDKVDGLWSGAIEELSTEVLNLTMRAVVNEAGVGKLKNELAQLKKEGRELTESANEIIRDGFGNLSGTDCETLAKLVGKRDELYKKIAEIEKHLSNCK